jgi:peptidoglycan/LPS O-acetylase OafA/YrhL
MKSLQVENSGRVHHLDALRGGAAVSVAVGHILGTFPNFESWTPILARPAVTLFFLLSGYVLGKSLSGGGCGNHVIDLLTYCIRRIFRLYPAIFIALIVAAILARFYVIPDPLVDLSLWFRKSISKATTIHGLHDYLGSFRLYYLRLDPPLWTIQIEFVCSLLLPLLVWPTKKHPFLEWMVMAALGYLKFFHPSLLGMATYLFEFYLGYLAWRLAPRVSKVSPKVSKYIIILSAFGALSWMWFRDRSGVGLVSIVSIAFLLTLLGPCRWQSLKSVLNTAPLQFLGRISYSLYLIHLPILMICWSLIIGRWGAIHGDLRQVMILLLTVLPISLILASLMEGFVERPFNNWGHWISRGIKNFLNPAGLS